MGIFSTTGVPGAFALAVMIACAVGTVAAVSPGSAQAADRDRSGVVEEIIVTSRRREESQQDVPVSVTAFREADIERVAPRTLRDFDGLMPNVFIGMNTAGPSAGAIYIRGLGYADIEKTQSPAVGVIVDGIYGASSTAQLIDTFDVASVEVNRGPQGVLFGKNTTGGTIVVERVKPKLDEFGWKVAAQVGSFSERIAKARVNIPLGDKAALKIGGITKQADGYFDNLTRGGDAGAIDYKAYTASLLFEPTDTLDIQLTIDKIKDTGDIPPQDPRYNGFDPYKNEADLDESQFLDSEMVGLRINWNTDFGTFTSITGYSDSTDTVFQDFDGSDINNTAVPLVQLHTLRDQDFDTFTQEFRLAGDFSEQVNYTVGAYYLSTELDFFQGTNQVLQLPSVALGFPLGAPCAPVLPANSIVPSLCQIGPSLSIQRSSEDVESMGVFGAVNWRVIDKLELSFGARYIDEEKDFATAFFGGSFQGSPVGNITPPVATDGMPATLSVPKQSDSWDDTIVKFTATFEPTDTNSLFFSFAQGFRSGGFSIRGIDPDFLTYEPESVDAYEIGSKNDFFDKRLRVNLSVFFTEFENQQFSSIVTNPSAGPGQPGTNTIINNGGTTDIWGAEAEITAVLNENLSWITTWGMQENDSDPFTISSRRVPLLPTNAATGTACNAIENPAIYPNNCPSITLGGGELGRAPEWNWSSTLVYGRELPGGSYLQVSATARGQDEFVIVGGATSTAPQREDGYTLLDARISWEMPLANDSNVMISLIGKNLGDREYREQALPLGANGGFQGWAPPATYAAEFVWSH